MRRLVLSLGLIPIFMSGAASGADNPWIVPQTPGPGWSHSDSRSFAPADMGNRRAPAQRGNGGFEQGDGGYDQLPDRDTIKEPGKRVQNGVPGRNSARQNNDTRSGNSRYITRNAPQSTTRRARRAPRTNIRERAPRVENGLYPPLDGKIESFERSENSRRSNRSARRSDRFDDRRQRQKQYDRERFTERGYGTGNPGSGYYGNPGYYGTPYAPGRSGYGGLGSMYGLPGMMAFPGLGYPGLW